MTHPGFVENFALFVGYGGLWVESLQTALCDSHSYNILLNLMGNRYVMLSANLFVC